MMSELSALVCSTKQLIIDVIRTQPGDTLSEVLKASVSTDQVKGYVLMRDSC